jgi:hypothetical protein
MARIRIKGLVKLMNHARDLMASGIPASEFPGFKRMILETITFVEDLCRANGLPLSELPAPTRRAYEYLKRIDFENLPISDDRKTERVSTLRISGIVSKCRKFQLEFSDLAEKKIAHGSKDKDLERKLVALHSCISDLAKMVDKGCEKGGGTPDLLPGPTRRAYQWLRFLSERVNFNDHFRLLTRIYHEVPNAHIELYNLGGLYRVQIKKGVRRIVIHEAFIRAPLSIIRDLISVVASGKRDQSKSRIQAYADTDEFRETFLSIETIGVRMEARTRGAVYDLEEIFKRVNDRYFKGRMEKPILTWNKIPTSTKFGHYISSSDTLMISITLDAADVPQYVLDQVMHHELLHKQLGVKMVNGRRIAHTAEFRSKERRFKNYREAQAFLAKLSGGQRNH